MTNFIKKELPIAACTAALLSVLVGCNTASTTVDTDIAEPTPVASEEIIETSVSGEFSGDFSAEVSNEPSGEASGDFSGEAEVDFVETESVDG